MLSTYNTQYSKILNSTPYTAFYMHSNQISSLFICNALTHTIAKQTHKHTHTAGKQLYSIACTLTLAFNLCPYATHVTLPTATSVCPCVCLRECVCMCVCMPPFRTHVSVCKPLYCLNEEIGLRPSIHVKLLP